MQRHIILSLLMPWFTALHAEESKPYAELIKARLSESIAATSPPDAAP